MSGAEIIWLDVATCSLGKRLAVTRLRRDLYADQKGLGSPWDGAGESNREAQTLFLYNTLISLTISTLLAVSVINLKLLRQQTTAQDNSHQNLLM